MFIVVTLFMTQQFFKRLAKILSSYFLGNLTNKVNKCSLVQCCSIAARFDFLTQIASSIMVEKKITRP